MSEPKKPPRKRPARTRRKKDPLARHPRDYQKFVNRYYDGFAGWFTVVTGIVTGHETLSGNLINDKAFDVRGCKRVLDAGCGNGRYLRSLLKRADPDALLVGIDFSKGMLKRARKRVRSGRVALAAADLGRLPFPDRTFDAVVCGWVLEHFQDPRVALRELSRVTREGGKLLLLVTEDTVPGAVCSRFYHCRRYRRDELRAACAACGLEWAREHWFSGFHKAFRLGGIVVELRARKSDPPR